MNLKVVLFFIVISLFLSWIWLPAGQIVGGGDVGIPTYLPQRALKVVSYSWWETQATGTSNPAAFTAIPFYLILSGLDELGFGPDFTQKGFIILILTGGAISIYFLAKEFEFGQWSSFLAALFYIFNLTSLSVWHRGVHNAMLMLLLMPLSLSIIARGVKNKKYLSILWINIISILTSYVYGTPAYIAAIWILWLTFLVIKLKVGFHDKKERRFIITYIFVLFISWVGLNAWWLLHFLEGSRQFVGQFSSEELHQRSSNVAEDLKVYTKPEYVLRGLNAYSHYGNLDWGNFYLSFFAIFISWIPTILIFFTLLIRENYKKAYWIFLVSLMVIVIFISKGVNAPLGGLNKLAYDYIPALAVLRNPYEKIGILLIIPYSFLFALGCSQVMQFLKLINKIMLKLFILLLVIASIGILVWPMWKGEIFRTAKGKSYFEVPQYYAEASKWFEELYDDTRILHLPLAPGESVDYDWGYTGIEPSQLFFPGSSIAYSTGSENIDLMTRNLLTLIHNQENVPLEKMLSLLNVGWVVVHNETVWRNRSLEPVDRINAWFQTNPYFLEYTKDFGPLSVWRVKDQYSLGHFFSTDKFTVESTIKPTESIIYSALDILNKEESFNSLAEVRYLPDSIIYPFIIFMENISSFLNQNDSVINCFALSGKRLKEAALLYRQNKFTETNKSLLSYEQQLDKCSKTSKDIVMRYMAVGSLRSLILGQLIKQKTVLDAEFTDTRVASENKAAKVKLRKYLTNLGLTSRYDPIKIDNGKQRIILHYSISKAGSYNIKLDKPDEDLVKTPPKIVQIDTESVDLTSVETNTATIKYPAYKFSKGFHEIQLETDLNRNFLEEQIQSKKINPDHGFVTETDPVTKQPIFTGKTSSELINLTFNLPNIEIGQDYRLHFDAFLNQGRPPFVIITHDNDPLDSAGNQIPAVKYQIEDSFGNYPVSWINIKMNYSPLLNATAARLSLILVPSDSNMLFQPALTEAKFKNIDFEKIPSNLVLEDTDSTFIQKMHQADISWKKINPTLYEVTLSNQQPPFTMVFSETFYPSWKVVDSTGQVIDLPHFSINGFANAWSVEKPLPQKVYIKFVLQDARDKGILISTASAILVIGIVVVLDRRRKLNA